MENNQNEPLTANIVGSSSDKRHHLARYKTVVSNNSSIGSVRIRARLWLLGTLRCARYGCRNPGCIGGHVWLKSHRKGTERNGSRLLHFKIYSFLNPGKSSNSITFIVPLCWSCNNSRSLDYDGKNWFPLKPGTVAITSRTSPEMFRRGRRKTKSQRRKNKDLRKYQAVDLTDFTMLILLLLIL